ncbi:MAG TPA: glycosyltransferase [Thermomicrobiales bacterium]|jgi:D-inositol-3-phosphate glycosyltransferase
MGFDNGRGTGDFGNIRRVAMISMHTSPIATLGAKDAGGMNVYVRELSRQLGRQGVAVDIFTRRNDSTTPDVVEPFENVRVVTITAGPPATVPKEALFAYLGEFASEMALFGLRDGVSYDVIHAHYWLSGMAALLLRRYWDAPIVQMFHTLAALKKEAAKGAADGQEPPLRIESERQLISRVDAIVAGNARERAEMTWWYGQCSSKIQTIPCGIDLEQFFPRDRAAARAELGLGSAPILLFVGRIDPVKGIDFLIEGYAGLRAGWSGAEAPQLVIVGGELIDGELGPDLARVRDQAARYGVADGLIFRGPQSHERLARYYAATDLTVVPSRYESFGLVAIESMACGTPVVASRAGGLAYTVEEGRNGLLVPYGDPPALTNALDRALRDDVLYQRMSIGAFATAQAYSWADVATRVLTLYRETNAARQTALASLPAIAAGD